MFSIANALKNTLCSNTVRKVGRISLINATNIINKKRYYMKLQAKLSIEDKTKALYAPMLTSVRSGGSFHMPYTMSHIEERVLLVLKLYDKVNPDTLTLDSHFYEDLGLDSLDHVEVIIAMEDEFDFEIPEEHSNRFMRPRDFVRYVADRFDIYE